ncbi:MAG: hypothetical protein EOP04_19380, partial [Proteobacteria bacterium]
MEDYFERNVRGIFTKTNWPGLSSASFSNFSPAVFLLKGNESISEKTDQQTIASMFASANAPSEQPIGTSQIAAPKSGYCRSVITFPQLLIHTYRIHRYKNQMGDFAPTFHVARLIEIFEELGSKSIQEIESFFLLLWQTRFTLDKYIIKWTADVDSKEQYLELSRMNKNSDHYFGRNLLDDASQAGGFDALLEFQ